MLMKEQLIDFIDKNIDIFNKLKIKLTCFNKNKNAPLLIY